MEQGEAEAVLERRLDAGQWNLLVRFIDLLVEANTRFNLTSVRDREGIYRRHVLESLAIATVLERQGLLIPGTRLIDVGSGGGVPGLPLAIIHPDVEVVLLEATAKKAGFLGDTASLLNLPNALALSARAEEAGQNSAYRESATLVTARAVAPLDILAELTLPLVRVGGAVAAIKGSRVEDEIAAAHAAISTCGGTMEAVLPLAAPGREPLVVVLLRKQRATPDRYPRRAGIPTKRPLR